MNEERDRELPTSDLAPSTPTSDEPAASRDPSAEPDEPLVPLDRSDDLRRQWEGIQTRFVDEPRRSVEEADELVDEVLRLVADRYSSERASLESQWGSGGNVSTEALRLTLQRYRSFFHRLLTA